MSNSLILVQNVFFSSYRLSSHYNFVFFQVLFDYLKDTNSRVVANTAAKRTAHEYKFKLPVNYAFPVTY